MKADEMIEQRVMQCHLLLCQTLGHEQPPECDPHAGRLVVGHWGIRGRGILEQTLEEDGSGHRVDVSLGDVGVRSAQHRHEFACLALGQLARLAVDLDHDDYLPSHGRRGA